MKRRLSKRCKLYLINGIAAVVLCIFYILISLFAHEFSLVRLFIYLILQCGFTLLSLIIYYISIIADSMTNRYDTNEKK